MEIGAASAREELDWVRRNKISQSDRDALTSPLQKRLEADRAARPFINCAYPPYAGALTPSDDIVICRCEEVSAGDIRRMAGFGCISPNQTKAFGRVRMGPSQGRYCGLSVTQILPEANKLPLQEIGCYRVRPPLKPVTLGEIAALAKYETSEVRK
ncbi:hypothetical protein [Pseudorhodobacter antarcticus]|uniref:hypothetical protein n=1 Tax=Pseudorhodobacter antarcticus TaxID=1077947 RepID=UPI0018CC9428|nr:hypothetical protein [Pseudorhodobacter antarcticus]